MAEVTNKQKKQRGTLQKIPKMKDSILKMIPDPSDRLDKNAVPYYYQICKVLAENERLAEPYLLTIERYAMYTYRFWALEINTRKDLGIQVAQSGYQQKSAEQNIMNDIEKNFQWFEVKFGLNPLDQDKVPRIEEIEKDDLFDD